MNCLGEKPLQGAHWGWRERPWGPGVTPGTHIPTSPRRARGGGHPQGGRAGGSESGRGWHKLPVLQCPREPPRQPGDPWERLRENCWQGPAEPKPSGARGKAAAFIPQVLVSGFREGKVIHFSCLWSAAPWELLPKESVFSLELRTEGCWS